MSWSSYGFRPYVPVAQRRRNAEKAAKKLAGKGRSLSPVSIAGRNVATTFWGNAWCKNLESYSDFANRLPRGRTYVRNGSVIDLQISAGTVSALVQGSELYRIAITISALSPIQWKNFKALCAGRITNLLDLLQGKLSKEILADITAHDAGLFPAPAEIKLGCSCPDWADMCKHVAAVLYGVGARLDTEPALFFTLRGVDMQELIAAASASATTTIAGAPAADVALADADLSAIFGVEIETAAAPTVAASSAAAPSTAKTPPKKRPKKPERKKSATLRKQKPTQAVKRTRTK